MTPDLSNQVVDALPIGSIVTRFGNNYITGYSALDGSTLSTTTYSSLLNYALNSNQVVETYVYDGEMDTNGYCYKFGYNSGDTSFRLPTIPSINNIYSYIKVTNILVPSN